MKHSPHLAAFTLVAGIVATSAAHNHITVDTSSGSPGDSIGIRAGYYPSESAYSIFDNRLYFNGAIAVYNVTGQLTQSGPLHGWYAGDDLLLTSDFYFATGRLDGGNFQWELVEITSVGGGSPASAAWGDFNTAGTLNPLAQSSAGTRLGRSFDTLVAGHDHKQGYAFSQPGLYDLKFVVWDSNGVYADSEPVKARFQVGDACPPDFNHDGFLTGDDYDAFVAAFEQGDLAADYNGDGFVTGDDFDAYVAAFEDGC